MAFIKYSDCSWREPIVLGVVRKTLGLTFIGESRDEHSIVGDIHMKGLSTEVSTSLAILRQYDQIILLL
jgi:hypothetical protein